MTYKIGSPTSTAVKICGITKLDQAKAIASIGVDAIGLIGVKDSPRFVEESQRKEIFSQLTNFFPSLKRVWVIADLTDAQIVRGLETQGAPSIVQLHGGESQKRCAELRGNYPEIQWWKAIRIRNPKDLELAFCYEEYADALLLDAWSPSDLGGTGQRLPLEWLKATEFHVPWWLAGGINAEWIPEIFSQIAPFGIDASSRLEASPGIKDLQKVKDLVKAIKKR